MNIWTWYKHQILSYIKTFHLISILSILEQYLMVKTILTLLSHTNLRLEVNKGQPNGGYTSKNNLII